MSPPWSSFTPLRRVWPSLTKTASGTWGTCRAGLSAGEQVAPGGCGQDAPAPSWCGSSSAQAFGLFQGGGGGWKTCRETSLLLVLPAPSQGCTWPRYHGCCRGLSTVMCGPGRELLVRRWGHSCAVNRHRCTGAHQDPTVTGHVRNPLVCKGSKCVKGKCQ